MTPGPATARTVEHVMGLPISLALRGRHTTDTAANDAWRAVLAELRRIDAVFSRYRPDTVISRPLTAKVSAAGWQPSVSLAKASSRALAARGPSGA